ncbi:hydrolase [Candidatus Sumerlaeota bacterium]|nr:hydrolase [Candidatus Sumerlaeota bacterium]
MTHPHMLDPARTALVVIDVQERLMPVIEGGERVIERCRRLIEGFQILGLPILVTEQYPRGLGPTVPALREALGEAQIIEKREFSACGCEEFLRASEGHGQLLLCGVETHVCVGQTAHEALEAGHQVHIAADAVGSRHLENRQIGLEKMRASGAVISTTEIALFELLRTSAHPQFKAISRLIQ